MREKTGGSLMSTGLDSGEARERQGHGRAGLYPGGGGTAEGGMWQGWRLGDQDECQWKVTENQEGL